MQKQPTFRSSVARQEILVRTYETPTVYIISITGSMTGRNGAYILKAVERLKNISKTTVAIEMHNVLHIDSAGLAALVNTRKYLIERSYRVVLVGCVEAVRQALSLTRIEALFPIYPTIHSIP